MDRWVRLLRTTLNVFKYALPRVTAAHGPIAMLPSSSARLPLHNESRQSQTSDMGRALGKSHIIVSCLHGFTPPVL